MDSNINLFSNTANAAENDKVTPKGFYRSRIYTSNTGINPLIAACDPILALATTLPSIEYPPDRDKFLQDLAHEIRAFEHRAQMANYSSNTITAARYALCCLLDETIALTSEWGKNHGWLQNNLLTIFYNENYGGAYFFTIIDQALENTANNLHLIELLYLCLSFGFVGKYYEIESGKSELTSITNKLYQIICQYRRTNHQSLFICDTKSEQQPQQNHRPIIVPQIELTILLSITAIAAIIISGFIYFGIHLKLRNISKPLYSIIDYTADAESKQSQTKIKL